MKTLKLLYLLALITSPAIAADEPPAPAAQPQTEQPAPQPAPTPTPGKFYLEVDQADLQILSAGISELPKKIADPLLLKLNGQLNPQVQATIKAQQEALPKGDKIPLPKPRPGKRD